MPLIPVSFAAEDVYNELPDNMDPLWRSYFESADFDGDGVTYPYDHYLGRDDNTVDFSTKSGGSLVMSLDDPTTFDPLDLDISITSNMAPKLFDTLIQLVPGNDTLMPGVAKAWDVSEDQLHYTFYLREDIKFPNGESLTAEDVIFTFDRIFSEVNGGYISSLINKTASYGVVDENTVEVVLSEPYSPFLSHLANPHFSILAKDFLLEHEALGCPMDDVIDTEPYGSGPWVLSEYVQGEYLVLDANKHYWAGRPYLDNIVIRFTNDGEETLSQWENGKTDVLPFYTYDYEYMLAKYPDKISMEVRNATYWQLMNCTQWPFNNKAVRQAVSCAIDTSSIIGTYFFDYHVQARGPLPPTFTGFSETLYNDYDFTYNLEKANIILDNAGIIDSDGDGVRELGGEPLVFEFSIYGGYMYQQAAEQWAQNLGEVGITMVTETCDFFDMLRNALEGNYHMVSLGWIADYADAEIFFKTFESVNFGNPNISRYSNEIFDALLQEYRATLNPASKAELAYQMQEILQEDCPVVWFFHPVDVIAVHDWIHDYTLNPMGIHYEKLLGTWSNRRNITIEAEPLCLIFGEDASSMISLQATYSNGTHVPDGTPVSFTSTAGFVTTISTEIVDGYAYTSLISPETAKTALVTAHVEGYGTAEIPVFFTNEPTNVSLYQTEYVCNDTLDANEYSDIAINVDGHATVTVANYTNPPATGFMGTCGDYFDLFIADTSSVNEVELRLYYDEAELGSIPEEDLSISWYDGEQWCVCTPTCVNTGENYIWLLVSDESTPTLEDLQGTYFTYGIPNADSVLAFIDEMITPWGIQNSIEKKIEQAQLLNDRGAHHVAQNILGALINALDAQRGNHIPEDVANYLIGTVHAWIEDPSLM